MKALAAAITAALLPHASTDMAPGAVQGANDEPPVTIAVATERPLVLGVDQEALLVITLAEALAAAVRPPRIICSAGHVEDVIQMGPRRFEATFILPEERFPQAAIVAAEIDQPDGPPMTGFLALPLRAAASPAFRTDPGSSVTLRIGEKEYGPQKADDVGNVRLPVVVPPGIGSGTARSTNRSGRAAEHTIDLKIPAFRRILIAAPERIAAGAVVETTVYAVEATGQPADGASIVLGVTGIKVQPLGTSPGAARFLIRAPRTLASGPLRFVAVLRNEPESVVDLKVPLVADQAVRLVMEPDRSRLSIGPESSMRLYLHAEDRFGNRVDAKEIAVLVDGAAIDTRPHDDGRLVAIVPAPAVYRGQDHVEIESAIGSTYARQRIPLASARPMPTRSQPSLADAPRMGITPRVGMVWDLRQPPGISLMADAAGRLSRWPPGLLAGVGFGYLGRWFSIDDPSGMSRIDLNHFAALGIVRMRRRTDRRLAVSLGVGAGAAWSFVRVRSYGFDVEEAALSPLVEASGEMEALAGRRNVLVFGARYRHQWLGKLSGGDVIAGNAAGLILDLGYRLTF